MLQTTGDPIARPSHPPAAAMAGPRTDPTAGHLAAPHGTPGFSRSPASTSPRGGVDDGSGGGGNRRTLSANSIKDPSLGLQDGDPIVKSLPANPKSLMSFEDSQWSLQVLVHSVLKVLSRDQVMIIVMVPYTIHWVTQQSQRLLGQSSEDVGKITEALDSVLGGPNSELVAEHIVRASSCAEMGISTRHTIELSASERAYRADLDTYFHDPDLHAIVALLTPLSDRVPPGYEKAQLASIRYNIGVEDNKRGGTEHDRDSATSSSGNSFSGAGNAHQAIDDFIPPMTYREVDYFYSLLPPHHGAHPELDLAASASVHEQEKNSMDPDHMDPHMRMRVMQENSLLPVLPREPRKFAEVQQEIMDARTLALQRASSNRKKSDTKCLECGIDNSPEWRKGPLGPKTLCNRCGLRYAKKLRTQK